MFVKRTIITIAAAIAAVIVFSAIWDLFHFAQPGGSLLMNALSGIWFAVTASAAFVICGVE